MKRWNFYLSVYRDDGPREDRMINSTAPTEHEARRVAFELARENHCWVEELILQKVRTI